MVRVLVRGDASDGNPLTLRDSVSSQENPAKLQFRIRLDDRVMVFRASFDSPVNLPYDKVEY
jgi:hypothetical protein